MPTNPVSRKLPSFLVVLLAAGCAPDQPPPPPPAPPAAPPLPWFAVRSEAQRAAAAEGSGGAALHDFRFTDLIESSGIRFETRIVDDAGSQHKKVHYDHGTGVAAADVDGDGLADLYFVTQLGSNELWKNLGGGRFTDITDAAGLRLPDAIAVAASFADIDNDGDPDLFVTTVRHGNHLYENLGGGRFQDIGEAAGVAYSGHSSGAVFFDYDRDGLLDLFVTNVGRYTTDQVGRGGYYVGVPDAFLGHIYPKRAEASILYRNLGGNRFQDVSRATGLVDRSWSGDATILDANQDGWPDLYVPSMQGADHLWLNRGGKGFQDATAQYFPRTSWGAMGVKAFDYNGDQRDDLLVTDMHSDMWVILPGEAVGAEAEKVDTADRRVRPEFFPEGKGRFLHGNALFVNEDGGFREVSEAVGAETYWPWGPSVDDLNADGWDDVFIASSMNFPLRYHPNIVLLNQAGTRFLHAEFLLGIEPRVGNVTERPWFRLACQGADQASPFCRFCLRPGVTDPECQHRDPEGNFTFMGALGSRSAVILDLDGDWDLDIVTNEFFGRPQVLISDLAQTRPIDALAVRLRGTTSNRMGIGARVTVTLPGGRRLLKVLDGKSGYLSQSDLPLYFGLGEADQATGIEVVWPSGIRQTVPGPHLARRTVEIVEP